MTVSDKIIGDRLRVSQKPEILSWIILLGCFFCCTLIITSLTANPLLQGASVFCSVVAGLTIMGNWEDCVFEPQLNRVILSKSSWIGRLLSKVPENNTIIVPLDDIIDVRINKRDGLHLVLRSLPPVTVVNNGKMSRKDAKQLRHTISMFLHLERIETVTRDIMSYVNSPSYFQDLSEDEIEPVDVQLQDVETKKSASVGCRNAIKVIAIPDDRRRSQGRLIRII